MREGVRAVNRLDHASVDLNGPVLHAYRFPFWHRYSMNVIDDSSSCLWSLSLTSKADAVPMPQAGHGNRVRLKILTSDNGELVIKTMAP